MPNLIKFTPANIQRTSERRKTQPSQVVAFAKPVTDVVIEQVRDRIVRDWDRGVSPPQIAKQFGILRLVVDRIIHERRNQWGKPEQQQQRKAA